MRRALLVTLLLFAATPAAAVADLVQVEVAPGVTAPLERNMPGLQIVEDAPGHFILANHPPAPAPNPGVPEPVFSGQRPVGARAGALMARVKEFWASDADRSLRPGGALDTRALCPDGVVVYEVPLAMMPGVQGRGWHHVRPDGTMACVAWLRSDIVIMLTVDNYYFRREAYETATHEFGHAYGLPHTPTGVMAGDGTKPARSGAWAPLFCRQWARRALRRY